MVRTAYSDERAQIIWDFNKGKYDAKTRDNLLANLEAEQKPKLHSTAQHAAKKRRQAGPGAGM